MHTLRIIYINRDNSIKKIRFIRNFKIVNQLTGLGVEIT